MHEGFFDGPQMCIVLDDQSFIEILKEKEKAAWTSLKNVVQHFLRSLKSGNFKKIVSDLVNNCGKLGCLMNLKLHFLNSHIDYFAKNLADYSEEQGERFHRDIKEMERRYQGRWNVNMLVDYLLLDITKRSC